MKTIRNTIKWVGLIPRRLYRAWKKRQLVNRNPTLISRDCFGTMVYHDMGLRFLSPTINLFTDDADFLKLVRNLRGFMQSDVTQVVDNQSGGATGYPVGKIVCGDEEVILNFMHYKSFEEARNKWNERKQRINWSNIFILQIVPSVSAEYVREFDALPYEHKMLVTGVNPTGSSNVVEHPVFVQPGYYPGKVLEYKRRLWPKKYLDDIDYISFLNRGK